MKISMFAILFLAVMLPLSLPAAEEVGNSVAGVGALSCKDWKEGRSLKMPGVNNVFVSWVQGYMSALNVELLNGGDTHVPTIPKMDELLTHIDAACNAPDPPKMIFAIIRNYYKELKEVK